MDHLLLGCENSRLIWFACQLGIPTDSLQSVSFREWWEGLMDQGNSCGDVSIPSRVCMLEYLESKEVLRF